MLRRRKVYNTAGDAHGLTFTVYRRTNIFTDPTACERFLEVLDQERKKLDWEVWGYVLMPDHVLGWPKTFPYDVSELLRLVMQPVSSRLLSQMRFENDCRLPRLWNQGMGKHRLWQAGGGHDRTPVEGHALSWPRGAPGGATRQEITQGLATSPFPWSATERRTIHGWS